MKKRYLFPVVFLGAPVAGFVTAFIAAGVHSLFFCLLPLLAFVLGFFSSWYWGLLSGLLLFLGYTTATALIAYSEFDVFYGFVYIFPFIIGGFSILVIGALAPLARGGIRRIRSIVVLAILAFLVVWFGSMGWTRYHYYNQVIILCSEDITDLELYLPVGVVEGEICRELYDNPYNEPWADLTEDYTLELVITEHGEMAKLTIGKLDLRVPGPPGYPYVANIIFMLPENSRSTWLGLFVPWGGSTSHQVIGLMPRYNVMPIDEMRGEGRSRWLIKVSENIDVEEFETPIIVSSATDAQFEFRLENRTDWGSWINFGYGKSWTHRELIKYEGITSDDWVLVTVEVTSSMHIRGISD